MLTVSGIAHVAIKVRNAQASLDFYMDKLGFEEMFRLDRNGRLWIIYLRITDTQFLEIFPDGTGDSAPGDDLVGFNHLCLEVPDIHQSVREVEAKGIELFRTAKQGADGNWQAWIRDPDGHRIELMQMAPSNMQAEAIARIKAK